MKIKVTKKHINSGLKRQPDLCPIALAVKDSAKNIEYAMAYYDYLEVRTDDGIITHYKMTNKMLNFIINYDDGDLVNPIEFTTKEITLNNDQIAILAG